MTSVSSVSLYAPSTGWHTWLLLMGAHMVLWLHSGWSIHLWPLPPWQGLVSQCPFSSQQCWEPSQETRWKVCKRSEVPPRLHGQQPRRAGDTSGPSTPSAVEGVLVPNLVLLPCLFGCSSLEENLDWPTQRSPSRIPTGKQRTGP